MLTRQTLYIGDSRKLDSSVSSSSDYTYYFLHAHSNVINFERNLWQYLYKNSFKINLLVKPKKSHSHYAFNYEVCRGDFTIPSPPKNERQQRAWPTGNPAWRRIKPEVFLLVVTFRVFLQN